MNQHVRKTVGMLSASPFALLLMLTGCGEPSYAEAQIEEQYESGSGDSEEVEIEFDEDAARADAEQEVADEGYDGPCTIDCTGHDAGFDWAADGHEDYGTSRSPSFDEGQEAYEEAVEERLEEKREQFEDVGPDSDYAM